MPHLTRLPLDVLHIPEPCALPWEALHGGGGRRFCDPCQHHVTDTSSVTREELDVMLNHAADTGQRLCLSVRTSKTGEVITKPSGSEAEQHESSRRRRPLRLLAPTAMLALAACGTTPGRVAPDRIAGGLVHLHDADAPVRGMIERDPQPVPGMIAPLRPADTRPAEADPSDETVMLLGEVACQPPAGTP